MRAKKILSALTAASLAVAIVAVLTSAPAKTAEPQIRRTILLKFTPEATDAQIAQVLGDVRKAISGLQGLHNLFVGPQVKVYPGMIIGTHVRDTDIVVNPCITKKLTNVRAAVLEGQLPQWPLLGMTFLGSVEIRKENSLLELHSR